MTCAWCQGPLGKPRSGGPAKKFCCDEHRRLFHQSLRTWALRGYDAGLVPIEALRRIERESSQSAVYGDSGGD